MWPWVFQSVQLSHTLLSERGADEVLDVALNAPRCAIVTHFACPNGVLLELLDVALCVTKRATVALFWFPRGVLLEVLDLALDAPKCAIVTRFARREGCCWRCLMWL